MHPVDGRRDGRATTKMKKEKKKEKKGKVVVLRLGDNVPAVTMKRKMTSRRKEKKAKQKQEGKSRGSIDTGEYVTFATVADRETPCHRSCLQKQLSLGSSHIAAGPDISAIRQICEPSHNIGCACLGSFILDEPRRHS